MSVVSRSRHDHSVPPRLVRPAPLGSRPTAAWDSPPDGWDLVMPSFGDRVTTVADRPALTVMDSIARSINRRTFIKRVGQVGAVIGLSGARFLWGVESALAVNPCNACVNGATDNNPGACGPSEPCFSNECSGANGFQCNLSHTCNNGVSMEGRVYNTSDCTTTQPGFWEECCQRKLHRCRDCCGCRPHSSGGCNRNVCSAGARNKCICEYNVGTSCTPGTDTC